jgi:hypothetical protein
MTDKHKDVAEQKKAELVYDAKRKEFLEEYAAMSNDLAKKHKMRLIPIINWTERGAFPVFAVENYVPAEDSQEPEAQ